MAIVTPVVDGKIPEASKSDSTEKNNSLGYDQFLQLLCAEMQYQDPLEPTSNTEYVAQLATFSQMEATLNMQNTLLSQNANSLVGQYVIVKSNTDGASATAGFVDYVQYENDKQYLYINGNRYSLDMAKVLKSSRMKRGMMGVEACPISKPALRKLSSA